ncbi:MAG TPA: type III polyketide synthase [Micromonosporaceae bacterium]
MTRPVLAGFGVAQPAGLVRQAEVWDRYFAGHFDGSAGARRLFLSTGVSTRYAVANPVVEDVSGWSTGERMRRYAAEAPPLGRSAVSDALAAAELAPDDVGLLAVASCTGYTTPGLDVTLAAELGMPSDTQRLCIGHMGCYAALPGLGTVADFVACRRRPAVLVCVELPSLHIQPASREVPQLVAHALFGDAAAAVALRPGDRITPTAGRVPAVLDLVAHTDPATGDLMTWEITDHGFRMGLSPRVPDVLAGHVADTVGKLLARYGLTPSDVSGWAVHPGGPRILDVVESELGLPAEALRVSRATLRDHGNCSSATVLMVLATLLRQGTVAAGDYVVAMAFGPGLTLYAALLRG